MIRNAANAVSLGLAWSLPRVQEERLARNPAIWLDTALVWMQLEYYVYHNHRSLNNDAENSRLFLFYL